MSDKSMKPLLGLLVKEAVKHAIVDCLPLETTDDRRREVLWNVHSITNEEWIQIDPIALGQNVAVRLLGEGGWSIGQMYSANATPREILDACIERPDQDPLGDLKMDLNLGPTEPTQ